MKKLFMMAAVAALAIGVSSCNNGPNGGQEPEPTGGEETGMKVDIVMPGSGGLTRPATGDPVRGTNEESQVNSVFVFVFTADGGPNEGKKVATGGFTSIPNPTAFAEWFGAGVVDNATHEVVYTMQKPIEVTSGKVRVWIALNLPSSEVTYLSTNGYATEAEMLARTQVVASTAASPSSLTVADPSLASNKGFTMYSSGILKELESQTGAEVPANNVFQADVNRAVAKIVASNIYTVSGESTSTGYQIKWDAITETVNPAFTTGQALTLSYFPSHWRVFQDVEKSYIAPNPPIGGRPSTYMGTVTGGVQSYDNIFTYSNSIDHGGIAHELNYLTSASDSEIANPGAARYQYIGENATPAGQNANYQRSTMAILTTYVRANAYAKWDNTITNAGGQTADRGKGDVIWQQEIWGGNASDTGDDIHVLVLGGKKYFTKAAEVTPIVNGYVFREAARRGYHIIPTVYVTPGDPASGFAPITQDGPYPGTEIYQEQFLAMDENSDLNIVDFIYRKGYVHFWSFVQMNSAETAADLLRNQLIHMEITGIDATVAEDYTFVGYPGQNPANIYGTGSVPNGNPRIPIDLYGNENNPNPLVPGPVVPEQTTMKVNVNLRPWTYQKNQVTLQH